MRESMQRLLKSIRGAVHFPLRCSRRWRRAWKVRALTAVTVKPSRRAVSAFDSPCSSRSKATVRNFFRSREMAWATTARLSFSAKACSGVGRSSGRSIGEVGLTSLLLVSKSGVVTRLRRSIISASLIAMRVTQVANAESPRNRRRFTNAR